MPILDMDKQVRGHVTVFEDLTEKKKLEVMKSDFVSVVSHELRTPLTSIKLLSNAAKFSRAGEAVTIFIEQDDHQVTLGVRDRGAGIPEDFKDRVFERFTQSSSVNTKSKPGSGLGLTIAKSLVELHGGAIHFESEEGSGTTFYVHLPKTLVRPTSLSAAC